MKFAGGILVAMAAVAAVQGSPAHARWRRHVVHPRRRAPKQQAVASHNPLLPVQYPAEAFWPQLWVLQRKAMYAPPGFRPLYSKADWHAYTRLFGHAAMGVFRERMTARFKLAQAMLAEAARQAAHRGLARLLLTRAVALTFRYRAGFPIAQQAVVLYLHTADLRQPAQLGALWAMADGMAWQAATPPEMRLNCDRLAEQADVKLALELIAAQQINAAITMVRLMPRHAALAVRKDPVLFGQMRLASSLAFQAKATMDYLGRQYQRMQEGKASAALPLYLYARFVHPLPRFRRAVAAWQPKALPGQLEQALNAAQDNPDRLFHAARLLAAAAGQLPAGLVRDRTLFAACVDYRRYIRSSTTTHHRIKRTLARIALQRMLASGAAGIPHVHPLHDTYANDPFSMAQPAQPAVAVAMVRAGKPAATAP